MDSLTIERIEETRGRIAQALSTSERLRFVADFLDLCEAALGSPNHQIRYSVFHEISYLLNEHACDAVIWDWLQEKARTANQEQRSDMQIAIFALVPDPPIIWSHVFRLWEMWFDPQARWAVFAAYQPCPRRLHAHLRRFVAHQRRHGLPIPEFSNQEFEAFLKSKHE